MSTYQSPHSSSRRTALLEQLIVALTSGGPGMTPLPIRTRAQDDPTIALLDAWATVGDVLGFYLDRIADEGYLPNRVSSPSVFSPHNAPDGCFSLQAEITFPPGDGYLRIADEALITHVQEGFVSAGLVEAGCDPVFRDVLRLEFAYVVYTNGYEDAVAMVREWAKSVGITIHGRFGSFDYLNVDGCVRRSQALASELNGRSTPLPEVA